MGNHVLFVRPKQDGERLAYVGARDLCAVDVELGEERIVQGCLGSFAAASVGTLRRFKQRERVVQDLLAEVQTLIGTFDGVSDVGTFLAEGLDALAQLVFRPALFAGQVEQVVLLVVKRFKPLLVLLAQFIWQATLGGNGRIHTVANSA